LSFETFVDSSVLLDLAKFALRSGGNQIEIRRKRNRAASNTCEQQVKKR